jgi:SAM-dependent methyltransferase
MIANSVTQWRVLVASRPNTVDYREVMQEPDDNHGCGKVLRLDIDWRWHRPKLRRRVPRGEPPIEERPLRCLIGDQVIGAPAGRLPFDDQSINRVECGSVFAFARNDEGLASELGRIVRTGGTITLSVPATGLLAGLDSFNLYRYLVDVTKRGLRPFETSDIGWRRHYSLTDLRILLGDNGFDLVSHRRSTVALAEAVRLSGFLLFRWLRPSRNRYRWVARLSNRTLAIEQKISWRHGYWLEMELRKREHATGGVPGRVR